MATAHLIEHYSSVYVRKTRFWTNYSGYAFAISICQFRFDRLPLCFKSTLLKIRRTKLSNSSNRSLASTMLLTNPADSPPWKLRNWRAQVRSLHFSKNLKPETHSSNEICTWPSMEFNNLGFEWFSRRCSAKSKLKTCHPCLNLPPLYFLLQSYSGTISNRHCGRCTEASLGFFSGIRPFWNPLEKSKNPAQSRWTQ